MKRLHRLLLGSGCVIALTSTAAIVQAGGWDNFKLRYFSLTQHFSDQNKELNDLRRKGIDVEATARVSLEEILNGGPPKDGIPSIDNPKFDTAATSPYDPSETVIGVEINGEAVAYPFGIMNWHEIVNDRVGGQNISVTYCPLCDTIVAFDRGDSSFGVSGKLFRSCLVMYDRADDTLYAQPWGIGVVGPAVNQMVDRIPTTKTTLGAWLQKHPNSKILSTDTGHEREYQGYPYGTYYTDAKIIFPVPNQKALKNHPKEIVTYAWDEDAGTPTNRFSGPSQQFVHAELKQEGERVVKLGDRQVRARWDKALETVVVEEMDGTTLPTSTAFAFVYSAFFGGDR